MSSTYCLSIAILNESVELAYVTVYELGMLGCEEQSVVDKIKLNVFFNNEETARLAGESLKTQCGIADYTVAKVENQDWNAKWRESMEPACIADRWYVSPTWLPPPAGASEWIKIEPKMAFGTGHHETTRLASQAIISLSGSLSAARVLDIGSGSGVLCFVASRCGAPFCLGLELDECCRGNMAENLRDNGKKGTIRFAMGSTSAIKDTNRFSVIVMNMIMAESSPLLQAVSRFLVAGTGRFIWSGILKDERDEALMLANQAGFEVQTETSEHEWWCGVFTAPEK